MRQPQPRDRVGEPDLGRATRFALPGRQQRGPCPDRAQLPKDLCHLAAVARTAPQERLGELARADAAKTCNFFVELARSSRRRGPAPAAPIVRVVGLKAPGHRSGDRGDRLVQRHGRNLEATRQRPMVGGSTFARRRPGALSTDAGVVPGPWDGRRSMSWQPQPSTESCRELGWQSSRTRMWLPNPSIGRRDVGRQPRRRLTGSECLGRHSRRGHAVAQLWGRVARPRAEVRRAWRWAPVGAGRSRRRGRSG